ncbi:DUF397 domain-containing protein [Streptomyces sp. DSM 44917]|uniref:DUF397 domain-containing protein n=1 Tax=Streptomyces boetiae TaxID=3075541 RepID=A0ABU2LDJ9_9ACTN|nr:DUF397 domain-containing protein [Streptomyces sp. DSM 44917]MDT0309582.1 DUF397 domain-containing protein [Streptomyces sp. DSM 44917]
MNSELTWFKSSYSTDQGGDCVEVAYDWRKSSHSTDQGGECVEIAACPHAIHVRDSKDTSIPSFAAAPAAWSAFLGFASAR